MATPLLTTKLYIPPARPELVPRPRLIERLNEGMTRKLTLISAPAGFGKTTLLSEWVAGCGRPVAWVSLDRGDNDLARFWAYFVAAVQTIPSLSEAGVGEAALAALESPRPPPLESVLTALINDIAAVPAPFALVVDDYHLIEAQPIHDALAFLLDHLPPQMNLVIASRADPPLPLSRLRGRGHLTELRTADLRFTPDEASAFLNEVMGLGLSAEKITALEARTEGWIVGLQMAALSMQGRDPGSIAGFIAAFSGSHRYVLDYLTDEVLLQQPESVQTFLLQTAILDRLTGSLCDAVTGQGNGQEMLEQLEAANLFIIPLDDERQWYRYHHLFADLLRKRLSQTQSDLLPALHRRASEWYEQNRLIADAVSHALAAGDVGQVARVVEGNTLAMMDHGDLKTLVSQLDALPDEMVRSRPWLCVAHAWVLANAGQLDAVELLLRDAEKALGALERVEAGRITGRIAFLRAYVATNRGDTSRAVELAREALEHLPEQDLQMRGYGISQLGVALLESGDLTAAALAYAKAVAVSQAAGDSHVSVMALCRLAALQILLGQIHKAAVSCREALGCAEESLRRTGRQLPATGYAYLRLSSVLYEWNDLEAALHHAGKGIELSKQWGQADILILGHLILAKALQATGDADGAINAIQEARRIRSDFSDSSSASLAAWEARLHLGQGDVASAIRWAQESGLSVEDDLNFAHGQDYRILARVLIAWGRLDEAWGLLTPLLEMTDAARAMSYVIETLVLQALTLQAQGKDAEAQTALERALSLAEPEGFVRIFVDEGEPMAALLRTAASRGIAATPGVAQDYVGKLLAAFGEAVSPLPPHPSPPLIEPLSERELTVLRFLAAGLSNREIAEELYLSINTVKTHTKSIYGKLNVRSRTQAANRARELGLL